MILFIHYENLLVEREWYSGGAFEGASAGICCETPAGCALFARNQGKSGSNRGGFAGI